MHPTSWKQKSPTFTFQGLIGATFPRTSLVFTHGSDSPQTQKTSCPLSQRCSGLVLRVSPGPGLFCRARNPPGSFLGGALALEPRLHLHGVSRAVRQHVLPWLPQNRVSLVTVAGPLCPERSHWPTLRQVPNYRLEAASPPPPLLSLPGQPYHLLLLFPSPTNFLSLHLLVILSGAFPDFRSTPLMKVLRHTWTYLSFQRLPSAPSYLEGSLLLQSSQHLLLPLQGRYIFPLFAAWLWPHSHLPLVFVVRSISLDVYESMLFLTEATRKGNVAGRGYAQAGGR